MLGDKTKRQNEKAAIEARRAYYKQWRANNKDKVKLYNQRYWEKKAAESEAVGGKANTE